MSVNRASEVWKEIKPFAIRDMNRMVDNKSGDSGDDQYAIILYDESAQKIKYYSMSAEGLQAALLAASSGDIIWVPAGTINNISNSIEIPGTITNSKALDLGTSGSPPANWNKLSFDDSSWQAPVITTLLPFDEVPPAKTLWTTTGPNTDKALFRHVFVAPSSFATATLKWDGDDINEGIYVNEVLVDSWPIQETGDDHPTRTVDITEHIIPGENNILAIYHNNFGNSEGSISWVLVFEEGDYIVIPVGVEVVGLGSNSIIDGFVENNGILTNISVTGTVLGSGIKRLVSNLNQELFSNQIRSLVATGTAPFAVDSTTLVANLNADLLDGLHASELGADPDSVDISSNDADIAGVNFLEQESNPTTPETGHRVLFTKSDGVYEIDDGGNVVGPFGAITFNDAEGNPTTVDSDPASDGISVYPARRDHKHALGDIAAGGKYRQFVYAIVSGDFSFVIDDDGKPVMALQELE